MPERRTKKPMTYKERVAENERALKAENEAFERQKEKLLKKHEGEFVIMYKGKVFDHDPDCHTLLQRAVPMLGDVHYLVRPVVRKPLRFETSMGVFEWD
jgi:hypothetical protein